MFQWSILELLCNQIKEIVSDQQGDHFGHHTGADTSRSAGAKGLNEHVENGGHARNGQPLHPDPDDSVSVHCLLL